MRKSLIMLSLLAGILVMALLSMPVWAAPTSLSDNDLSAISGKDVEIIDDSAGNGVGCGGCIQYGTYSWSDLHTQDGSKDKGANDISGVSSAVQQNVMAPMNGINWGAYASTSVTASSVSGNVNLDFETWATQDIGGF